ncbi:hypothetical protein L345_08232, partial [Ophiophagus hannah]
MFQIFHLHLQGTLTPKATVFPQTITHSSLNLGHIISLLLPKSPILAQNRFGISCYQQLLQLHRNHSLLWKVCSEQSRTTLILGLALILPVVLILSTARLVLLPIVTMGILLLPAASLLLTMIRTVVLLLPASRLLLLLVLSMVLLLLLLSVA